MIPVPGRKALTVHGLAQVPLGDVCAAVRSSSRPDPLRYLVAGEGQIIKTGTRKRVRAQPKAPKAGALLPRKNPPNTAFRRYYERGDLPLRVDHHTSGNQTRWDVSSECYHLTCACKLRATEHVVTCSFEQIVCSAHVRLTGRGGSPSSPACYMYSRSSRVHDEVEPHRHMFDRC